MGDEVQVLPCEGRHVFHPPCLAPWLAEHNSCPTCRCELPSLPPPELLSLLFGGHGSSRGACMVLQGRCAGPTALATSTHAAGTSFRPTTTSTKRARSASDGMRRTRGAPPTRSATTSSCTSSRQPRVPSSTSPACNSHVERQGVLERVPRGSLVLPCRVSQLSTSLSTGPTSRKHGWQRRAPAGISQRDALLPPAPHSRHPGGAPLPEGALPASPHAHADCAALYNRFHTPRPATLLRAACLLARARDSGGAAPAHVNTRQL